MGQYKISAMAEHFKNNHNSIPQTPFTFRILDKASDYTDRKIRESFFISKKNPLSIEIRAGHFFNIILTPFLLYFSIDLVEEISMICL